MSAMKPTPPFHFNSAPKNYTRTIRGVGSEDGPATSAQHCPILGKRLHAIILLYLYSL